MKWLLLSFLCLVSALRLRAANSSDANFSALHGGGSSSGTQPREDELEEFHDTFACEEGIRLRGKCLNHPASLSPSPTVSRQNSNDSDHSTIFESIEFDTFPTRTQSAPISAHAFEESEPLEQFGLDNEKKRSKSIELGKMQPKKGHFLNFSHRKWDKRIVEQIKERGHFLRKMSFFKNREKSENVPIERTPPREIVHEAEEEIAPHRGKLGKLFEFGKGKGSGQEQTDHPTVDETGQGKGVKLNTGEHKPGQSEGDEGNAGSSKKPTKKPKQFWKTINTNIRKISILPRGSKSEKPRGANAINQSLEPLHLLLA